MLGSRKKRIKAILFGRKSLPNIDDRKSSSKINCPFRPTVYHALVVIFLEFFSWGLLIQPVITVLNDTFANNALLMNGLVQGVKGLLSFLSAPLIGALSDIWGRKPFLLLTVTFTCAPIPLLAISHMWYFAITSLSGVFAVTFSIVFAYVADVTTKEERSAAYGLVSATFAASLVISPAIGAYLGSLYGDGLVIALASAIAALDVLFILLAVPESLSETTHPDVHQPKISWEKADPFASLRQIGHDKVILMLCVTVFLSYLPEAGEYSSFFVYLRLVMGFNAEQIAAYIAMIGLLSCLAQTALLAVLMQQCGNKQTVIIGLLFETLQLFMIGFFSQAWILWTAGAVAALGSITYPAISVFVSARAAPDRQGVAQGVVTGIRSLCNGLGPALYGFIFYLFHVDLNESGPHPSGGGSAPGIDRGGSGGFSTVSTPNLTSSFSGVRDWAVPGPPFAFGGLLVIGAMVVAFFMPRHSGACSNAPSDSSTNDSLAFEASECGEFIETRLLRDVDQSSEEEIG